MEHEVTRRKRILRITAIGLALGMLAGESAAQTSTGHERSRSRAWIAAGAGSTTVLGDCTDCAPGTYLHTGSTLFGGGFSLNDRADIGADVLWIPLRLTNGDQVRSTLMMASVQVRPWASRGFFLKGSSGMAFLRNWLDVVEDTPTTSTSKAFTLGLGAGWEWRTRGHLGFQVFGTHHVVALGDLAGRERRLENVVGNFWSVGGGVMIR